MELPESHIYLVASSEGRLDAFAPLFDLAWRPQRLLLLAEPSEAKLLERLTRYLEERGFDVLPFILDFRSPRSALDRARVLLQRWQRGPFALNLSGADGLLLWAGLELCRERGGLVFHRRGAELELLSAPGGIGLLQPSWRLYDLLTLAGIDAEGGAIEGWPAPLHRSFSLRLLSELPALQLPLSRLRRWAEQAARGSSQALRSALLEEGVQGLIERFEAMRLLELSEGRLRFLDEPRRLFCAGRWLTLCLYEALYAQLNRAELPSEFAFEVELQPLDASLPPSMVELLCASGERVFAFKLIEGEASGLLALQRLSTLREQLTRIEPVLFGLTPPSDRLYQRATDLDIPLCMPQELTRLPRWFAEQLSIQSGSARSPRAPRQLSAPPSERPQSASPPP